MKRLQEFDLLRIAATFAVINIHVTAGYIDKSSLAFVWNHIVRFAVPLFIVMSGFLLYHTDQDDSVFQPIKFYRRRLDRILGPYIIWSFIYCLFNAYLLRYSSPLVFLHYLGNSLLWGTAYYHLYFLQIILQFYLLYPWLRRWLVKSPRGLFTASLFLTAVVQILLYLNLLHIISLPHHNNFLSFLYLSSFPVWLFYFVLGMFAAQYISLKPKTVYKRSRTLGSIWLITLVIMIMDSKLTGMQGSIVRPTVMLYTTSSFFFFYTLAMLPRQKDRPWLTWLSAQSFVIYLIHPLLLIILIKLVPHLGFPALWNGDQGMALLCCATTVAAIASAYIISLTPLARLLGGSPK